MKEKQTKKNNQGNKPKKDSIKSVRQSPGDSGVLSGILATRIAVLVGYDESRSDWAKTVEVQIPTHCGSGYYSLRVPTGALQSAMFNMDDDTAVWMSQIGIRAGTNRDQFEGNKKPSFFDSDYAGKTLPSGKSGSKNRRVPIQRSGKHQGRAVPCYQPKNYNLKFLTEVLCKSFMIVPPSETRYGVRFVGETTPWLEKFEGVNRVSYTSFVRGEEE